MRCRSFVVVSVVLGLLMAGTAQAILISTGFEASEGYVADARLASPSQPGTVGDVGWGGNQWKQLTGNFTDPNGYVRARADAPQGSQYYQRLGAHQDNLTYREFPAITPTDGDFSLSWRVRLDTDRQTPNYFTNYATLELENTAGTSGSSKRIMTFRYRQEGTVELTNVNSNIAKWDGTGSPNLKSALNQWVRGGVNVHWATKKVEVFMENTSGAWESIGEFNFREMNTARVNRIYLGVGPGGVGYPDRGVSWDDLVFSSTLIPEPATLALLALGGCFVTRRRRG